MLGWILSPVDPGRIHDVGFWLSWHARLMVVAWVILIPVGIISARFFKIWPGQQWPQTLDNKNWWYLHRTLQYIAVGLMLAALGFIWQAPRDHVLSGPHKWLGWTVLSLVAAQVTGTILRGTKGGPTEPHRDGSFRGDHYDMSLRRRAFEIFHKTTGYSSLFLSVGSVLSGLWQSNAPRWMWIVLGLWWVLVALVYGILQSRGMAISTYRAIWGDDPDLPGNRPRERRR